MALTEKEKQYSRKWQAKNRAYQKQYREQHKTKIHLANKKWRIENKEYRREYNLKYLYNISKEEFNIMYVNQSGKCAICSKGIDILSCAVDHNHTTGKVRGLLCRSCNSGIGLLNDDPKLLQKAIKYLKNST